MKKSISLHVFHTQVERQCKFALIAYDDMKEALSSVQQRGPSINSQDIKEFQTHMARQAAAQDRFWYSVQAFLVAAGNISKLFWPSKKQPQRLPQRGSELRISLEVENDSPLKLRGFMDRFEHFDTCLDTWVAKPHHHFVDSLIGPANNWFGGFKPEPETCFRIFDTTTFALTSQGETYLLPPIIEAIQTLYLRAMARTQNPYGK